MEDREPYITGGKMRDKFLTEAMGDQWHSYSPAKIPYCDGDTTIDSFKCSCGYMHGWCEQSFINHAYRNNPDFSTWEGFGKLWEWAIEQDWWLKFKGAIQKEIGAYSLRDCIEDKWINPGNFADAIYEYLKNKV